MPRPYPLVVLCATRRVFIQVDYAFPCTMYRGHESPDVETSALGWILLIVQLRVSEGVYVGIQKEIGVYGVVVRRWVCIHYD